jgi:hypothetical protein
MMCLHYGQTLIRERQCLVIAGFDNRKSILCDVGIVVNSKCTEHFPKPGWFRKIPLKERALDRFFP